MILLDNSLCKPIDQSGKVNLAAVNPCDQFALKLLVVAPVSLFISPIPCWRFPPFSDRHANLWLISFQWQGGGPAVLNTYTFTAEV